MLYDFPENFYKTHLSEKYGSVESNVHKFLDMNQGEVRTQVSVVQTKKTSFQNLFLERSTCLRYVLLGNCIKSLNTLEGSYKIAI